MQLQWAQPHLISGPLLEDAKLFESWMNMQEHTFRMEMRRACMEIRWPSLTKPLLVDVQGFQFKIRGWGDRPRDQWRSLVVQFRRHLWDEAHKWKPRVSSQYEIQYKAQNITFDARITIIPIS